MKGKHLEYLYKIKDGKIKQGLGLDIDLDNHLLWKKGQFNVILGNNNVGKTFWFNWYALCLSMKHDIKWCIYSGENDTSHIIRDMITMLSGHDLIELSYEEIRYYNTRIENCFEFIDNKTMYKPEDLLKIFADKEADSFLIDPVTALDRKFQYADTYEFLNEARNFCNNTKKTLYLTTHPVTEAGRSGNMYPKGHMWEGFIKFPLKSHCEGGYAYSNRCDDMIICHRLTNHPEMKYYTMIDIAKVRDTTTGGSPTNIDQPLLFEYNYGKGFKMNSKDALKNYREIKTNTLWN